MMPQLDQLDFLLSDGLTLDHNVIYIFQRNSRFMRHRTTKKVMDAIEASGFYVTSSDPNEHPSLENILFHERNCKFIDLWIFETTGEGPNLRTETNITQFLRKIVEERGEGPRLAMVVPAVKYHSSTGPVWWNTPWPNWLSVTKYTTIIVEPTVSIENAEVIVEKLMRLSDLPNLSAICNYDALVTYLKYYVQDESPTLLELSYQVDKAILIGVDRTSQRFDAQALGENGTEGTDAPSIGISLRSFLAEPTRENARSAVYALDERLNRKLIAISDALRQLWRATATHVCSQIDPDSRTVLWAWLVLTLKMPTSKGALIDAYLGVITHYRVFCSSGLVNSAFFDLDVVLNAKASGWGAETSSLDRAKGELAQKLADHVCNLFEPTAPDWVLKLRLALQFEAQSGVEQN